MLEEILAYNKKFVEDKGYEAYITNKYPDKKIAILSCMDTRLTACQTARKSSGLSVQPNWMFSAIVPEKSSGLWPL